MVIARPRKRIVRLMRPRALAPDWESQMLKKAVPVVDAFELWFRRGLPIRLIMRKSGDARRAFSISTAEVTALEAM